MAKRIVEMAKKCRLFDQVIITVVGQRPDVEKVQGDIAKGLGLTLLENDLQDRSSQISNALNESNNYILVILDDVWHSILLEEDVGIRIRREDPRIKVMFTSRKQDVLEVMQVHKVFQVESLREDEAWSLFKDRSEDKVENLHLHHIAEGLVKLCKGVPLILSILASVLKERDESFWVDALAELTSCARSRLPLVPDYVYSVVNRSVFILCSLSRTDSDIFLEELVRYGIGMNIFPRIMNLDDARSRVSQQIGVLKGHSLLLNGHDPVNAKMHDVVRDVAISVAPEVNHDARSVSWEEREEYTHLSLIPIELSKELKFPHLPILRLQCNLNPVVLPDDLFDGMTMVYVLNISGAYFKTLPSLHLIAQLRKLSLHSCSVKNISTVGHLLNLEILSCYDCSGIELLPVEIGKLDRLRLLELYQCQNLKTVTPGVISRLVLLEELKVRGSFTQWQASVHQEQMNAALTELQCLSHLASLEIEVEDPKVITSLIEHPFPHVTKYYMKVGTKDFYSQVPQPYRIIPASHDTRVQLSMPDGSVPAYWVSRMLTRTEDVSLSGNGLTNLVLEEFERMKKLRYNHCSNISHLFNSTGGGSIFRFLESSYLEDLVNLQSLCAVGSFPIPSSPFVNLKSVDIRNCKALQYVFALSIAVSLDQVEELRVLFCGKMKQVLLNDLNDERSFTITFPRLKKLILYSLPSLVVFCRGLKSMKFPLLQFLSITNVPRLHENRPFHVYFNQEIDFDSLKEISLHGVDDTISQIWSSEIPRHHFFALEKLHIGACNKLKYLFTPSVAGALVRLKELQVRDSLMIAEVIANVEQETEGRLFPSLEGIELIEEFFPMGNGYNDAMSKTFEHLHVP